MRLKTRSSVDFAAAGRPDEGGDAIGAEREIDVLQRMVFAVIEIQVARGDLGPRLGLPAIDGTGRREH